jgi:hypothetical protein
VKETIIRNVIGHLKPFVTTVHRARQNGGKKDNNTKNTMLKKFRNRKGEIENKKYQHQLIHYVRALTVCFFFDES